jgi:hypothetical protein
MACWQSSQRRCEKAEWPSPNTPDGVEVYAPANVRLIVINHNKLKPVDLPHAMHDLIGSGDSSLSVIDLPGYGVAVLEGK